MLSKKKILIYVILCLLALCMVCVGIYQIFIKDSYIGLEEYTGNPEEQIMIDSESYIRVIGFDLQPVNLERKPFGFVGDGNAKPKLYSIQNVQDQEWVYLYYDGEMMNFGDLFRRADIVEPDINTFSPDQIQLTDSALWPFSSRKAKESYTDSSLIRALVSRISGPQANSVQIDTPDPVFRCGYLLSSKYPGLAYAAFYLHRSDADGKIYFSLQYDTNQVTRYFDVTDLFGTIK